MTMKPRVVTRRDHQHFVLFLHYCAAGCGRRVAVCDSRCLYCAEEGKPSLAERFCIEAMPRFDGPSAGAFMTMWAMSEFKRRAKESYRPESIMVCEPRPSCFWENK